MTLLILGRTRSWRDEPRLGFGAVRNMLVALLLVSGTQRSAWGETEELGASIEGRDSLRELSLEDLMSVQVVTGAAQAHASSEAPSSVYVITAETIRRRGYRHLGALLADLPGVQVNEQSHVEFDQEIAVRGIRGNDRFIILLDGYRISAIGTAQSIAENFSLANAERVEVLLGPASALYGADAFSGVANIITTRGDEIDGVRVSSGYGIYNTTNNSLVAGGHLGAISASVTASFDYSDEPNLANAYRDDYAWYHERYLTEGVVRSSVYGPSSRVVEVPIESYAAPRMSYFLDARLDFSDVSVGYTRHHDSHSTSLSSRPEFALYVPDAKWAYTIQSFHLQHDYDPPNLPLTLRTSLSLATYDLDPESAFLNSYDAYGEAGKYKYEQHLTARFEERASYELSNELTLSVGGVYQDFSGQPKSTDLLTPIDPDVAPDAQGQIYPNTDVTSVDGVDLSVPIRFYSYRYQNFGAYTELQANPLRGLNITAGARFDHNTRYGSALNPRAAVVLAPTRLTRIKLMYGEAMLAPSPAITYQHFGSFEVVENEAGEITGLNSSFWYLPNPGLKPERLRAVEAAASHTFANHLQLSVNGFYTRSRSLIFGKQNPSITEFAGWPVSTVHTYVNGGKRTIEGGTARVDWRLDAGPVWINPYLAYTYTTGATRLTAPHSVKGGLDVAWRQLSLSTRVLVRSKAPFPEPSGGGDPANPPIPASAVVNAYLRCSDIVTTDHLSLSVWVRATNLLNSRYYHMTDAIDSFFRAPQDPIGVVVGVDGTL